jgi:O-antigen ligase
MRSATIQIAGQNREPAHRGAAPRKSVSHRLVLALVAVTIVSSGFVFSEPAPVDALTIGLIVLLPVVGLVSFNPTLIAYFSLWTVAGACAVLAAALSLDLGITLPHVAVTLYLTLASVVFAGFIAKSPTAHSELIFKAWTWAAVGAAGCGLVGYFGLLPGAYELFTKFGRASGPFKDPNVFGPFLVPPLVYMVHVALGRPWHRMLAPLAIAGLLMLTVLLTFSRGAWMNLAVALAIFGYLTMLTSRRTITRVKLMALLVAGLLFTAGLITIALSTDYISDLLVQRSTLEMEYDSGTEGRFGGQQKAIGLITENPLGLGALEFGERYHPEEVHNVYLSMLLNAGWLGGGIYWILVALTAVLGFRHALKATPTQPLFLIVYAAFMANAGEGIIIDSDHWRHFYLLAAMVWGLMSARTLAQPAIDATWAAISSRRPARLRPTLPVAARRARRAPSIVGAMALA